MRAVPKTRAARINLLNSSTLISIKALAHNLLHTICAEHWKTAPWRAVCMQADYTAAPAPWTGSRLAHCMRRIGQACCPKNRLNNKSQTNQGLASITACLRTCFSTVSVHHTAQSWSVLPGMHADAIESYKSRAYAVVATFAHKFIHS